MAKKKIVIEKFTYAKLWLKWHLNRGDSIYVIEPFHAYHHRSQSKRFCPAEMPLYVRGLLRTGKATLIPAKSLFPEQIYFNSTEKAVKNIQMVMSAYRRRHKELLNYLTKKLDAREAENAFYHSLCDRLAEFYSTNELIHKISNYLQKREFVFYSAMNIYSYLAVRSLLLNVRGDFYDDKEILFPFLAYLSAFSKDVIGKIQVFSHLLGQVVLSRFIQTNIMPPKKLRKTYAFTIIAPRRQLLEKSYRKPDFLVDGRIIKRNEAIYIPLVPLNASQKKNLHKMVGEIMYLPRPGKYFSNRDEWQGLLGLGIKYYLSGNGQEIKLACNLFFNYFLWKNLLRSVSFRHFITHADFGPNHIGRNIALKQAGIQTWFFMDSMNQMDNFVNCIGKKFMRHPFWTYLLYDHLVLWSSYKAGYYLSHPGCIGRVHVVGCLWSSHIREKEKVLNEIDTTLMKISQKEIKRYYIISAFDSSYSKNSFTCFEEGILFARHLLRLVDEIPDIYILFKEKKEKNAHRHFDADKAPELIKLYLEMDVHPRITLLSPKEADSADLISISDMVISFPFTSTTFEALSANRIAVWHDPMDKYRNTLFGKIDAVMTHNFNDLKKKVQQIRTGMHKKDYTHFEFMHSPLMDPFRDGRGIYRFRKLLKDS